MAQNETRIRLFNGSSRELFRKGAELNVPIYVDGPMHKHLERLAKKKGTPVADLVNRLLKRDLELLESLS